MKRNCSISPRQLAMFYAALCATSLAVALFFAIRGAWYILGFAVLEMAVVGLAFLHFGRHARDREHIKLVDDCLVIELIRAEKVQRFSLESRWTRVRLAAECNGLIGLEAGNASVEVGRFLTEWKRREFAQELRCALASSG